VVRFADDAGSIDVNTISRLLGCSGIDRHFFGQSACQGDLGSYSLMLPLENDIIVRDFQPAIRRLLVTLAGAKLWRNNLGCVSASTAQSRYIISKDSNCWPHTSNGNNVVVFRKKVNIISE
jgi:hypothetical protein